MKFFYKKKLIKLRLKKNFLKNFKKPNYFNKLFFNLVGFLFKEGFSKKYKKFLHKTIYNFYFNLLNINKNNFFKQTSFNKVFNLITNLIKPPFVIKVTSVPKKLKKKIGIKYFLKIQYKNDSIRIKSAYKHIKNSTNSYFEPKFKERLFRVLLNTYCE